MAPTRARVVELVDASDSKSDPARGAGSIPAPGTIQQSTDLNRGLTQTAAAKRMSLTQPKVSNLLRGEFSNFSERKLMDCLNRLGYDIEICVRETTEPVGHLVLIHA